MKKFSDEIECAEEIAAHLVRNVPAPWRLIEVLVQIVHEDEMVTTECIYYPQARGSKKDWFGIEDACENVLFGQCFIELSHLTSTQEQGYFKRCKFTLEPDGKYRTNYEY